MSVVVGGRVELVGLGGGYIEVADLAWDLVAETARTQVLFLLTVDRILNYSIDFEYDDMERWMITRRNGGTGVPR